MDRETVITHLQIIHTWAEFAHERDLQFFTAKHLEDIAQWTNDAMNLLKEQEKQKFFVDENGEITPLPVVVRCKDCVHRGKAEKCVLAAISEEKDCPLFMLDNRGEWFCADGERKETT